MHTEATFFTDIPTLGIIGFLVTILVMKLSSPHGRAFNETELKKAARCANIATFTAFLAFVILVECATFLNIPYAVWIVHNVVGVQVTGTEFMWHGYTWFPFYGSVDSPPLWWWPVAAGLFLLQWLALVIGRYFGIKLFL